MNKNIKYMFLFVFAVLIIAGLIKLCKPNNMVKPGELKQKDRYSHTTMVETGGVYQFELYSSGIKIKKCDMKVNKDTIEFVSDTNTEIVPFFDFNYNTIALLSENQTSSMIIKIESNGKGYVKANLIGVVADDIVGEYTLVYKDKGDTEENIVWSSTGLVTKPGESKKVPKLTKDTRIMCLSQDKSGNAYLEIFNGSEWGSYSFYILGNTIFLEQVFG